MDDLLAWGLRIASGVLALLTLFYLASWMEAGGTSWIVAAVVSALASAGAAFASRNANV